MDDDKLKIWLPFDNSPTDDLLGNSWTTSGTPTISDNALYLDGSSYLKLDGKFDFSKQSFSVATKFSGTANTTGGTVGIWQLYYSATYRIQLGILSNGRLNFWASNGNTYDPVVNIQTAASVLDGNFHYCECTYDNGNWYFFLDGQLVKSVSFKSYVNRNFDLYIGTNFATGKIFTGYLKQFFFYNGVALHTADFNPTDDDYFIFDSYFDTRRKVAGNVQIDFDTLRKVKQRWRYENFGTADLLSVDGYTVQSEDAIFKSAFYQTERVKCFDIPATDEIWIKFDVYTTLNKRWRAYNGGSLGVCGFCSQTTGEASFLANGTNVKQFSNNTVKNQLQTCILHMVSSATEGIVEAWLDGDLLYTYTGNVNNGNDFEDIYLQSEGEQTTFSNVIISNLQIGLNENTTMPFDNTFDLLRRVLKPFDFAENFDAKRKIVNAVTDNFDTKLNFVRSVNFDADTFKQVIRSVIFNCDILRKIPHKLILSPAENLVVNPAVDNSTGIQSISIAIAEQQLTDQLTFVTENPVDIMQQIQGQFLDYAFNLRVESISQSGILTTCQCCSDIDELLYTQVSYKLGKSDRQGGFFVKDKTTGKSQTIQKPNAMASAHIFKIAAILHKVPILLFDNFQSTVDIEQGGVTYQDLISEIFGWTSRIPHKMINVFIRNNQLFVIQRGHEQHTYNIMRGFTEHQIANLVIKKSLVRTSWGVTQGTAEKKTGKYDTELVLGNEIPDLEAEKEKEEEERQANLLLRTVTVDNSKGSETTNYYGDGHIESTFAWSQTAKASNTVVTETTYEYDEDNNVIRTLTTTSGGDIDTIVFVENFYSKENGKKTLTVEKTTTYEGGEYVDTKTIVHNNTRNGQKTVIKFNDDGTINGAATAASRQTDLPSPLDMKGSPFTENLYYVERDGHIFVGGWDNAQYAPYVYQDGKKIEVVGIIKTPITETADTIELYDSSFPVDDNKARSITNDLKWLNRRIQETVSFDIYNFPHVFDFNDRIILNGNIYFLQSNNVEQTPDIVYKQSLQIVRWY